MHTPPAQEDPFSAIDGFEYVEVSWKLSSHFYFKLSFIKFTKYSSALRENVECKFLQQIEFPWHFWKWFIRIFQQNFELLRLNTHREKNGYFSFRPFSINIFLVKLRDFSCESSAQEKKYSLNVCFFGFAAAWHSQIMTRHYLKDKENLCWNISR